MLRITTAPGKSKRGRRVSKETRKPVGWQSGFWEALEYRSVTERAELYANSGI